jgi:hypothetical protein
MKYLKKRGVGKNSLKTLSYWIISNYRARHQLYPGGKIDILKEASLYRVLYYKPKEIVSLFFAPISYTSLVFEIVRLNEFPFGLNDTLPILRRRYEHNKYSWLFDELHVLKDRYTFYFAIYFSILSFSVVVI